MFLVTQSVLMKLLTSWHLVLYYYAMRRIHVVHGLEFVFLLIILAEY